MIQALKLNCHRLTFNISDCAGDVDCVKSETLLMMILSLLVWCWSHNHWLTATVVCSSNTGELGPNTRDIFLRLSGYRYGNNNEYSSSICQPHRSQLSSFPMKENISISDHRHQVRVGDYKRDSSMQRCRAGSNNCQIHSVIMNYCMQTRESSDTDHKNFMLTINCQVEEN